MSQLLGQVWRYLMEEEPSKQKEEVKDPSPEKEEYRKEEHSCCGRSSCSETKREPEVTDTDCGGPEDGDGAEENKELEDRLPKSELARPVWQGDQSSVNLGQLTIDTLRELLAEERAAAFVGPKLSEQYPSNFVHVTLHINPNTGKIHYDGDKRIDGWLKEIMAYHDAKRSNPHSCLSALDKLRNWLAKQ